VGDVVQFRRWRRFFGVEQLGEHQFRARSFIGWFPDPKMKPDTVICDHAEAVRRAQFAASRLGVPVIVDRVIWRGGRGGAA
jgi:hypothetical protein